MAATFKPGQCHHRSPKTGEPDCAEAIAAKGANLCPTHEAAWRKGAAERAAGRKVAEPKPAAKANLRAKPATAPVAPGAAPVAKVGRVGK